jgi:3-oxoacyl-(acyl-carrier-protein) synthase
MYIESFHCVTSTAKNSDELWEALTAKRTGIQKTQIESWPEAIQNFWKDQPYQPISCKIQNHDHSFTETFAQLLSEMGAKCLSKNPKQKMGVILSTTKGGIEDYVWDKNFAETQIDPLAVVLEKTLAKLPAQNWVLTQVVSNSCASSHASFALAKRWIESGAVQKVLILAGDLIGPFIHSGFQTLKALSSSNGKPFQLERDGLVLGEAMSAIMISQDYAEFELVDAQISNEAFTVTGPSPEGKGLQSCLNKMSHHKVSPDLAIAHGTATQLNDQTEDYVLAFAQKLFAKEFAIAGTKWSIGHTLGASGSMDVIAALLCLKNQQLFTLPGEAADPNLLAKNYQFGSTKKAALEAALVTSLGFGGTNGAILLRRSPK